MKRHILLAIAVAVVTTACDRVQLMAPTESELTLSAAATFLSPTGTTSISAFVIESAGTPVQNGTTVRFTTTLGRLDPAEAQTRNGVATTTFQADGASGVATIRATSGPATSDEGVEILVGTAAIDNIALRANPANVSASGGTTTLTARVTGENGQGLAGIPVAFTASAGTLSAPTATTDANGDASVELSTNRETVVTARAGGESDEITVEVNVAGTVTLSATAADAGQPTTLTVTPATGTNPRVTIDWGDGQQTNLGVVSSARTVTHVYEAPGTFTITATAVDGGETNTNSTTVVITPPDAVTIAVTPTTGSTAQVFTFTVTPNTAAGVQNVTIDFGDGTSRNLGAITAATQVQNRYGSPGTYIVRVTQTTATGAEIVTSTTLTVT